MSNNFYLKNIDMTDKRFDFYDIIIISLWAMLLGLAVCVSIISYNNYTLSKISNECLKTEVKNKDIEVAIIEEEHEEVPLFTREDEAYLEFNSLYRISDKRDYLLKYKEVCDEYADVFPVPESIYDVYTDEEINLMQRTIETETYGCDFESKTHVASVILNRIEGDNNFGNTVSDVIKPGQFCYHRKQITDDTVLALEYAYMIEDTSQGALYFHSGNRTDTFSGANYIFTDDAGHHFYK